MIQVLVGLGAMVGGAHLFVEELLHVAEDLGVEAIVLSLILAPLATELPEKVNSFFWVREGKDSLALGNITGRDGLPVDDPGRDRPHLHRLGAERQRRDLGRARPRRRA